MKKEKIIGIGASVLILVLTISPAIAGINTKVGESIFDYNEKDNPNTYQIDTYDITDYNNLFRELFIFFDCIVEIEWEYIFIWPGPGPRFPGGYLKYDIVAIGEWTLHIDPLVKPDFYREGNSLHDRLWISMWVVTPLDHSYIYMPNSFKAHCKVAFGYLEIQNSLTFI